VGANGAGKTNFFHGTRRRRLLAAAAALVASRAHATFLTLFLAARARCSHPLRAV
jgi:hypothetical protein